MEPAAACITGGVEQQTGRKMSSPISIRDQVLLADTQHQEMRKAVSCASDMFEMNVKCMANIVKLQKENERQRVQFDEACSV